MLTELQLKNFKAWKDTGSIRLAPLTVFFGTNSSGKSSLGQFLLMLKRTAQSPDRSRVLHSGGDERDPIDLGSFTELVYGHDRQRDLEFSFTWRPPKRVELKDILTKTTYPGDAIAFDSCVGYLPDSERLVCKSFNYTLLDSDKISMRVGMAPHSSERLKYTIEAEEYSLARQPGRPWPLPSPTRFYGFPNEVSASHQNADIVADLELELEHQLDRISYLGPLREIPHRTYVWSGEEPEHVGYHGEQAIVACLAASKRRISPAKKKRKKSFDEMVALWLKQMQLIHDFSIKEIAKGSRHYEALLQKNQGDVPVKLPDVGFGVSQVLPVIVQCFYAAKDSTLFIEQPEIHLHPSVQMDLADLFIQAIQARENGEDRNIQLLIESHSEWFLRRLQRRIAEQKISSKDVAIYFCRNEGHTATIEALGLDMFGDIENWPESFFGDQMDDIAEQSLAAIRGRRQMNSSVVGRDGQD